MIISNQEFVIKELPQYHPASQKYISFWKEEKRKCIEGVWISGKYMPGKLYYYINYGTIKRNLGTSKVKTYAKPLLRDLEWELFLLWTEARGFSGFVLDKEYTCLELVKEWREIGEDTPSLYIIENHPEAINIETGKLKKYVPPREYLHQVHKENLGRPLFENNSKNFFICGPRGWGKSYSVGGIIAHEYLFDGLDEYTTNISTAAEIVVGAGDAKYSSETLDKVKTIIDRLPGSMELGNVFYPSPFYKKYIGSWQPGSQITATYKKKLGKNWINAGTKSNIKHRTFKDNPFAANGTRPGIMLFEEVGLFDNLIESYVASVECQREGSRKFGSMIFIGTGGDMKSGTLDAQKMFYEPDNFDCLVFEDVWEFRGKIGYFIPAYMGLHDFKDIEGNTKVEEAKVYLDKERARLRRSKGSTAALESEIVNRPIVPSEMFMQKAGAIFPIVELRELKAHLEGNSIFSQMEIPVTLYFDPDNTSFNGINYKVDVKRELKPINAFPWKDSSREGAVVIYEFPQLIDSKVPKGAYIIGHDPYGSDSQDGDSLGSIFVLKTNKYFSEIGHNEIVAEYHGRPWQGRKIVNEILYKLSKFYGDAQIYFENVRGNVKEYFEKIRRLDLLAHKPITLFNKKAGYTQSPTLEYGYPMSSRDMKLEGAIYIRDWLLEERSTNESKVIRNLNLLRSRFLIDQLIAFNLEGNFDAVMAFMGCIVGLNETYNQYKEKSEVSRVSSFDKQIKELLTNNKRLFNI